MKDCTNSHLYLLLSPGYLCRQRLCISELYGAIQMFYYYYYYYFLPLVVKIPGVKNKDIIIIIIIIIIIVPTSTKPVGVNIKEKC